MDRVKSVPGRTSNKNARTQNQRRLAGWKEGGWSPRSLPLRRKHPAVLNFPDISEALEPPRRV